MPRPPPIPQRRQPAARPAQNQQQSALAKLIQQGLALQRQGKLAQARAIYESVLKANPRHFDSLHLLGVIEAQTGNHQAAVDMIGRAIAERPGHAGAHCNLGNAYKELGQLTAALVSYDKAIGIEPNHAQVHSNRGLALQGLGQLEAALASHDRAISLLPGYADAHFNRGNVLRALGQLEEAVTSYDTAISLRPDDPDVHVNRGVALHELGRFEPALAAYDVAIRARPDHLDALFNRAGVLKDTGRMEVAIADYDSVLRRRPDHAQAWSGRGIALQACGQYQAAIASYDRAVQLEPDQPQAWFNRGVAYQALGQLQAALVSYDRAIDFQPDYPDAYFNKALITLLTGDLARGWPLYEWRWKVSSKKLDKQQQLAAEWDGTSLAGALLVLAEQGVGDQIFYSGMLDDLRARVGSVTVALDERLLAIYQRSFPWLAMVSHQAPLDGRSFDAQIHMASLGQYLRADMASLAGVGRGYLRADAGRAHALRARVAGTNRLVCGLSWSSKNPELGQHKSLRLADLAALMARDDVSFVNLQYGDTGSEQAQLKASTGRALACVEDIDNFNDLDGLAALICACDVVITVSNTTAHLAAALGKPVWVLLPHAAGVFWYWHEDRTDSPWYPSARLYRQGQQGDWSPVLERVRADLDALAGAASGELVAPRHPSQQAQVITDPFT